MIWNLSLVFGGFMAGVAAHWGLRRAVLAQSHHGPYRGPR